MKAKPVHGFDYQHVLKNLDGPVGTGVSKGIAELSPSCETLEGEGMKFGVGIEFSSTYAYAPLVWLSWKEYELIMGQNCDCKV